MIIENVVPTNCRCSAVITPSNTRFLPCLCSVLILFGTYTIGKERLFLEVARQVNKKVYVSKEKAATLACCNLSPTYSALLTTNHLDTNIHAVSVKARPDYLERKQAVGLAKLWPFDGIKIAVLYSAKSALFADQNRTHDTHEYSTSCFGPCHGQCQPEEVCPAGFCGNIHWVGLKHRGFQGPVESEIYRTAGHILGSFLRICSKPRSWLGTQIGGSTLLPQLPFFCNLTSRRNTTTMPLIHD